MIMPSDGFESMVIYKLTERGSQEELIRNQIERAVIVFSYRQIK